MNEFLTLFIRWTVRIVMLTLGVVFFLSLLSVACLLAIAWGVRAVWAKLTGRTVTPWVMPMRTASNWAHMAQRAGGFSGMAAQAQATPDATPFGVNAGSKRGGVMAKVAGEVSDVQAREVH